MSALQAWLDQHGFGKYAKLFAKNDIGLDVLPDLTDSDLGSGPINRIPILSVS